MKKIANYVLIVTVLVSMLLGACTAAPGAAKVDSAPVAYTGTIESIDGDQWVVNGQIITVDPSVVRDGPFKVGDVIKVEVAVSQDGSLTVTRVELPQADDLIQLPEMGDDNSNDANGNDANSNDDNSNGGNSNDDNGNGSNSNDDNTNSNTNG